MAYSTTASAATASTTSSTTSRADRPVTTRYQVLAALQVLDVATTWVILANFAGRAEGNPVVAAFIHHSGLELAMVGLLVFKLAVVHVLWEKQTGINLMSAVYGLVVFNNLLVLVLSLL